MERPQRLLALLVALQANRQMTASELAAQFGVSRRTILRDIQALADADVPVVAERGRYGGIVLLPGADVDVNRLTGPEAEILELIGVDPARARQLGIEAAARTAAQKLAARRPWPHDQHEADGLLSLRDVVSIDNSAWFTAPEPADVAALTRDLRSGRRLRIAYRSSGQRTARRRTVDPYGAFARGDRWYLIADEDGEPRMFAVARLASWRVLDEKRRTRPGATLAKVAARLVDRLESGHALRVVALLDAETEDIARRILGSRLLRVDPADEPDAIRLTVGYEELDGVRQLLQFADHLEVIAPPEARALVARLARATAVRHERPSDSS